MTRISTTFLFILIPFFLFSQSSQPVTPIISNDYLKLIASVARVPDSGYNIRKDTLATDGWYGTGWPIKKIRVVNGRLKISPAHQYRLAIGGSLSATVELKTVNRLPALQQQYVQGRSLNGELVFQGPETNEVFSYGPALHAGAPLYHHPVFRTGVMLSQVFNLQAELKRNYNTIWDFDLKMGQSKEQTFIRENENSSKNLVVTLGKYFGDTKVSGSYNYLDNRFSNSNRNGFLNRVYQNSLLTPVSFGDVEKSYSAFADNPDFLLKNSPNNYFQTQKNASLIISRSKSDYDYTITQSYEKSAMNGREAYKPGTAYFPNGIMFQRDKQDANYFLNANGAYRITYDNDDFKSELKVDYILKHAHSSINDYKYQRTAQQLSFNFLNKYQSNNVELELGTGNRSYISNTLAKNSYIAPSLYLNAVLYNIIDRGHLKASIAYNQFNSELPISQSFSYANLLQYSTAQAFQYFPVKEITGYDQLLPVSHREWTGTLFFGYKSLSLTGEVFIRDVKDDMFPVFENGALQLKNIANHRKKGIDLQLHLFETQLFNKTFSTTNRLSFFAYNDIVTHVADGYNYTPVAGFSNVRKAIVKGSVLGSIVGNTYQRDAAHQLIIGPEGFPLVNDQLSVIGNPTPDFVMKMSNALRWKRLTLGVDWEWKKGGDMWNGTQAALDYYGRSALSGEKRNTKGYMFSGTTPDGHANNTPVDFYNPSLPVEKNRWVRYGVSGVAEDYIFKADYLRINNIQLSWYQTFKKLPFMQKVTLSAYVSNLMLWTAYKGVDPSQTLYDQSNAAGLDFFNLPAVKSYGFNVLLQF